MILKALLFINLLGYAFIASQAFFYLLAMANAQRHLRAPAYVELRNLLDKKSQCKVQNSVLHGARDQSIGLRAHCPQHGQPAVHDIRHCLHSLVH